MAIYDLLDSNQFEVTNQSGPYHLYLRTDQRHIHFDIRNEDDEALNNFFMALGPLRRIMRDYFFVYAIPIMKLFAPKTTSQIQAIDMGRRAA